MQRKTVQSETHTELSDKGKNNRTLHFRCSLGQRTVYSLPYYYMTSHVQLCDPTECSMPDFPVLRYLPEFAQTHVHWLRDAIQPSHPLLALLFLSSTFPSIRVLPNELALCSRWPKYWRLIFNISPSNEYSLLISLVYTFYIASNAISNQMSWNKSKASPFRWKYNIILPTTKLFNDAVCWKSTKYN